MGDQEQGRLESWKEIGAYLQRDVRTAHRWEKEEGLPVHRHSHNRRASVYAFPSEIDAWRASRKAVPEPPPARPLWKMPAFALTMAMCLVMVGNGLRPQVASAQGPVEKRVWAYGEMSPSGPPSLDGRYIGFTDWSTGDLGVHDLVAGFSRHLTNTGGLEADDYAEQSVISPDNRTITYLWHVAKDGVYELRLMPLTGGTPRTVYRGTNGNDSMFPLDWTPDGKKILAVHSLPDRTTQIAVVTVRDGSVQVIKSLGWQDYKTVRPRISPDGRFVVYQRLVDDETGAHNLFLLATDGSSERALVEHPANDGGPVWSPDGKRILFTSNRTGVPSLWSIAVENGKGVGPAALVRADMAAKLPLGITRDDVLYIDSKVRAQNIYVADLNSTKHVAGEARIATQRFLNANRGPAVSPDGVSLAYYSSRPGQGVVLVVRNLVTGQERDIAAQRQVAPIRGQGPKWFADGASVLVGLLPGSQKPGATLARLRLSDGNVEVLLKTEPLQGYTLSPDGKSIYYGEGSGGTGRFVRYDIETKRESVLKQGYAISTAVSPDGSQLAYLAEEFPDSGSYIAVRPVVGGEPRVVYRDSPWVDGSRWNGLTWSADGKSIMFVKGPGADPTVLDLWRVAVQGGPPERVGISSTGAIKSPQITPDGKQIYFGVDETNGALWALENFRPAASK